MAMQLVRGFRVFDTTNSLAERVHLSSGTRLMDQGHGYMDGGILPRDEWRAPSLGELDILRKHRRPEPRWGRLSPFIVSVVRVAGALETDGRREISAAAESVETWASFKESEVHRSYLESASKLAAPYHHGADPLTTFALVRKEAGLTSLAFDASLGELVGMHFDNYEKQPLAQRHLARNRLVINLGSTPRHLYFVNLPLMKIFKLLRVPEGAEAGNWSAYLAGAFVRRHPEYPVVRLRVDPGEGYIAATDHMIHDGSSALCGAPDVSLHFLGRFVGG